MATVLEFRDSPYEMSDAERLALGFDVADWGITCPLSPSAVILDSSGNDLSASLFAGSATISACTATCIITPRIQSLIAGCTYRLEVRWEDNHSTPNRYQAALMIKAAS